MAIPELDVHEMGRRIAVASTSTQFVDVIDLIHGAVPDYARERIEPQLDFMYDQVTDGDEPLLIGNVRIHFVNLGTVALLDFERDTSLSNDLIAFQQGTRAGRMPRYEARPNISRQLADTVGNLLKLSSYSAHRGAVYITNEAKAAKMLTFRDKIATRAAFLGHSWRHEILTSKQAEELLGKTQIQDANGNG